MQNKFESEVIEELVKQADLKRLDSTHLRALLSQNLEDLQEHERERLVCLSDILKKLHAAIVADIEEKSKGGERIVVQRKNHEILRRYFPNENLSVFIIKGESND